MEEKETYTGEDIAKMQTMDPKDLTSHQRQIANLHPAAVGEIRNPHGRPKGIKNWSVVFQHLLDDPKFFHSIVSSLPKDWNGVVGETSAEAIAAALIAATSRETLKELANGQPLSHDVREGIALINRLGFGEKFTVDTSDSFFHQTQIIFEVAQPPKQDQEYIEAENQIEHKEQLAIGADIIPDEPVPEIQNPNQQNAS